MKDSGSGVSPQDIPKLFTKFTQTQSTATRNSGGSGLGLAICKRYFFLCTYHLSYGCTELATEVVCSEFLAVLLMFYLFYYVIRFVNLMEGHIWIESEGLGKGCTTIFIVKLGIPERLNESKLPFMPKVSTNHGPTAFPGLKVLVMDENGSVLLC